ncbi:MAG: sulfatase [Verrucomicrobiae bacterium]|nr:sulfatase [Verrucomicrobiae bacterium]
MRWPTRLILLLLLPAGILRSAWSAEPRPNVLFILADDLGWHDLGCYGNPVFETPNLDRLASEGLRFTNAYAPAPICSASRASFLTGKSPARLGFEFVTKEEPGYQKIAAPLLAPPYPGDLALEEITIAETLSSAGYQTAFFGKWHLNRHYRHYLGWSPTHGPKAQGFQIAEEDFGSHPYSYWNQRKERAPLPLNEGEFPADSMNQRAIDFVRASHDKPFFLMVSHFFVHTPVHTRLGWLRDHYLEKLPADHPRREALSHYGAMVTTLDHLIGDLLDALRDSGQKKSTIVVFTSDNGGHPDYAGNAPLRGSKWNLYEGGIRVPFLVRWPGNIEPNRVSDHPVIGTDLYRTFAEVAGAVVPPDTEGPSLLPLFRVSEETRQPRDFFWHFPYYHPESGFDTAPQKIGIDDGITSQTRPQAALRSGPWKLIHFFEDNRDELYHLPSDPSEQKNRGQSDPEVLTRLRRELESNLKAAGARMPTANPNWPRP